MKRGKEGKPTMAPKLPVVVAIELDSPVGNPSRAEAEVPVASFI